MPQRPSAQRKSTPFEHAEALRFLVDETTGMSVAQFLRSLGYDTVSVGQWRPSATDQEVLEKAYRENRVLVTNDKDFGLLVYYSRHPHVGVVLLRLRDESLPTKRKVIQTLLRYHAGRLKGRFVVVSETKVRFR